MTDEVEARNYTAVITVNMPKGVTEEDEAKILDYMQDQFNNQWGQTWTALEGWTVTIHAEDPLDDDGPRRSCGCPEDYHMADCPRLTDTQQDPPEPDDDDRRYDREDDPYQATFATEEEARAFIRKYNVDEHRDTLSEWGGKWIVEHYSEEGHMVASQ